MTVSINSNKKFNTLKKSDIIETRIILCPDCDEELGEVMVIPGANPINKEGSKEYMLDTIKCICGCGQESFIFKFTGRIKFAPKFEIEEQYLEKNEIIVKYEKHNTDR